MSVSDLSGYGDCSPRSRRQNSSSTTLMAIIGADHAVVRCIQHAIGYLDPASESVQDRPDSTPNLRQTARTWRWALT